MTPIRTFLEKPPFLKPFERLQINYMLIDPQAPTGDGNAMAIAGMPQPVRSPDVVGNITLRERLNLIFVMQRFTNDEELRRDIGNFIVNYIRWIRYEQEQRGKPTENSLLPHFSETSYETIAATGGMGMGQVVVDSQPVDEFQIQLHIEFETQFFSKQKSILDGGL